MRAVVQRVTNAQVTVEGEVTGNIDAGLCVLVGVGTLRLRNGTGNVPPPGASRGLASPALAVSPPSATDVEPAAPHEHPERPLI